MKTYDTYQYDLNIIYCGKIDNGKANGYGALIYKNGDICYAHFKDGKISGGFKMYYKNPRHIVDGISK